MGRGRGADETKNIHVKLSSKKLSLGTDHLKIEFFLTGDGGGARGRLYCRNLNLDTRHNLIAWSRLQTNIFFLSFTQPFCITVN